MPRLSRWSDCWWCLFLIALLTAGSVLTIAHYADAMGTLDWAVLMGLIAIPVLCRVVNGTRADAQARLLAKMRERRGQRSWFLERQLSKSQRKTLTGKRKRKQLLDHGEVVILELRRHPLTMVSPRVLGLLLQNLLKGPVLLFKALVSAIGGFGVAAFLAIVVLFGYVAWQFRFWLLACIVLSLLTIALVMTRIWFTQTIVFTEQHIIWFDGITAKPTKVPLLKPYSFRPIRTPGSRAATNLRLAGAGWEDVLMFRTYGPGDVNPGTRQVREFKGLNGADLVLSSIIEPERQRLAELSQGRK